MKPVRSPPGSRTACDGYDQMLSTVTLLLSRTNEPPASGLESRRPGSPQRLPGVAGRIRRPRAAFGRFARLPWDPAATPRETGTGTQIGAPHTHGISAAPD
ncbi:hypothetical protein ACE1SV_56000 [Streptomyces sennicomposti]